MQRLLASMILLCSCARLNEQVTLRAEPLEPPRTERVQLGERMAVTGVREGDAVRAQVTRVQRCADVQTQRAAGFRHIERQPDGQSLLAEWLFGGLFTVGGVALIGATAAYPEPTGSGVASAPANYGFGAAITAVGLGLLAGAVYDNSLLGAHEEPLGERTLRKSGPEQVCSQAPAASGQVRLTLPDGAQLEANVDLTGRALLPLPANVEQRLEREGSRRATLEVIGDPRAQVRLEL
jgi:hypothetical protein